VIQQETIRERIHLRYSALLDMALSLLVLQNPERFGPAAAWAPRVAARLPAGLLEELRDLTEETDLFELAYELEQESVGPVPEALARLADQRLAGALQQYWTAISPEVASYTGLITESLMAESNRLATMEPLRFITHFSDRVSLSPDGADLLLEWGKGMRVPLAELSRILFIPSAFSPRRLMFYRLGPVQLFFYAPQTDLVEPPEAEVPESMSLGFSALADTTRLKLLRLIALESLPAQEMAQRLGLNESTVSRHLRLLVEAGLVGRERTEGKYIFYSLHANRVERLANELLRYLGRTR
jgi:DNA-binding transcriptional ArsR family regulator